MKILIRCTIVYFQVVADIIPKDTLVWKMKLLRSAADYANTCLHNVKAEVLLLARSIFLVCFL